MGKITFNGKSGVWRTIGGRRIFIEDGDDIATAMKKSGKFENTKKDSKKLAQKESTANEEKKDDDNSDKVAVYDNRGYNSNAKADPSYVDWAIKHATDEKDKEFWLRQKQEGGKSKPSYYIERNKNTNDDNAKNSTPYKKAFEEYKRKHPNSKLTFKQFLDIVEGK